MIHPSYLPMMRIPDFRRLGLGLTLLAALATAAFARTDQKFSSSPTLSTEARTLVQLLEQAHYNREAVHSADYGEVIPNYMGDLDGQRLFFLGSDKTAFTSQFG